MDRTFEKHKHKCLMKNEPYKLCHLKLTAKELANHHVIFEVREAMKYEIYCICHVKIDKSEALLLELLNSTTNNSHNLQ